MRSIHRVQNPTQRRKRVESNQPFSLVGVTGLEPAASCSQSTRATNCATPRNIFILLKFLSCDRTRFSPVGSVTLGENNTQLFSNTSRRFATFGIGPKAAPLPRCDATLTRTHPEEYYHKSPSHKRAYIIIAERC